MANSKTNENKTKRKTTKKTAPGSNVTRKSTAKGSTTTRKKGTTQKTAHKETIRKEMRAFL